MRVAHLAGRKVTPALEEAVAVLDPGAPNDYREIAALLANEWVAGPPTFVGLSGGQGAGKSTLSRLIAAACEGVGMRACVLSLDDFYFPLSVRRELAVDIHALLETRGPPGTHDIMRCQEVMSGLRNDDSKNGIELPVFDKGLDDRRASRRETGPFDIVLLEGWCVGAAPETESDLAASINSLEENEDPDGRWRRHVNAQLADQYAETWRMLDYLIYLRVPDLEAVRRWRLDQERERPLHQRMQPAAIDRFVQHFERTTLAMDRSLPGFADLVVELAADHSVSSVRIGSQRETT